jgi:amino acid permease
MAPRWAIAMLLVAGVVLVAVGIIYFSEPARHLPAFFPGHAASSTRHHTKHGLLAVVIALLAFAGAWIGSGRKRRRWDE